jgi:AraC-like DNA-binding protein
MPPKGALHYLDRIGDPFLFLEERFVDVAAGHSQVVTNHLPKAVFVLEGELRHSSGAGASALLKPGGVLINFQKKPNVYLPAQPRKGGRIRVLRLTFPWDFAQRKKRAGPSDDGFGPWLARQLPPYAILPLPDSEADSLLLRGLRACLSARDAGRRFRLNALARLVFLRLIQSRQSTSPPPPAHGRLLEDIELYLEEHLHRPLGLSEIARAVGRTEEHVARFFRRHRGTTVFGELRRLRIKRAQYLLLCSELDVTRIAERTGFATLAHFSRTFKEETGLPPSGYRERAGFHTRLAAGPPGGPE